MEFLKEIVSPLVPLVLEHMAYPFTASSNIRALESATRKLRALKEDVQTEIANDERENGVPTNQAKEWLSQIDTIEKEEEEIREKYRHLLSQFGHKSNNLTCLGISGGKLDRLKFERTSNDHRICRLGRLEELHFKRMANLKEVIWKGLDPKDVFPRLQELHFEGCHKLTSISWVVCLPCIRKLNVWHCSSIKQLIRVDELNNGGFTVSRPSFPFLKRMDLWGNNELEIISDPTITFSALELLAVQKCNKLKKLPFKTSDPPRVLVLRGTEEWWNNIEMEDNSHRSLLQSFFVKQD